MANKLQGLSYALPPNSRILAKEHYKRRRSGNYRIWGSRCATKYGSDKKYAKGRDLLRRLIMRKLIISPYTAISRKVVGKMCTRQSRKVIWDMIDTLFLTTLAVEPTFVAFL